MKAILLTPNDDKVSISFRTFKEAKGLLCDCEDEIIAEFVRLGNGQALMIDEDGKSKSLSYNAIATNIAYEHTAIYPHDFIVGNAILIENEADFDDLPYG